MAVIMRAKFVSSPPSASPITTATSFADLVTMALIAVSTRMLSPGLRPSLDGACAAACADTGISEERLSLPDWRRSNSR